LTRIGSGGARSNIKNDIVIGDCVGRDDPRWRVGSKGFANHQIDWHGDRPTLLTHDRYDRCRFADQIWLRQRFADIAAGSTQKGVGDAATNDEDVDLADQRTQDRELGRNLRSAHDRDERAFRQK